MAKLLRTLEHYQSHNRQPLVAVQCNGGELLVVRELSDRNRVTDFVSESGKRTPCVPNWWITKFTPSFKD